MTVNEWALFACTLVDFFGNGNYITVLLFLSIYLHGRPVPIFEMFANDDFLKVIMLYFGTH